MRVLARGRGLGLGLFLLLGQSFAQSTCSIVEIESSGAGIPVVTCGPASAGGGTGNGKTSTNSVGQTIISGSAGVATIPTGLTTLTTITLPSGTVTYSPPSGPGSQVTTTNAAGQTIISGSAGVATIPSGVTKPTTITLSSGTVIYSPPAASGSASTSTNTAGQTIISGGGNVFTIPTGVTTPVVLTGTSGSLTTFTPSRSSSNNNAGFTTVNPASQTIVSNTAGLFTIPTGVTTPVVLTGSSGTVFTFTPSSSAGPSGSSATTSINSASQTIVSDSAGAVTIPTGITTPVVITRPNGQTTTFTPSKSSSSSSSSSTSAAGVLIPVTTSVAAPGPGKTGSVIPCRIWFFNFCIKWGDIEVGGWEFNLPEGIHPPGPPPPFPKLPDFTISIKGSPPPWPQYTIGPNKSPTFPPEPTDGPDKCTTETAEYCATTTTFGVSTSGTITKTTSSSVLSTCGTLTGCALTGSSTTASRTSTCASGATATAGGSCPTDETYPYAVYPNNGEDSKQVDAITQKLQSFVSDKKDLTSSTDDHWGLNYWQLPLDLTAADDVRKIQNVASVSAVCSPDCTDDAKCVKCYDPTLGIRYQDPASASLQFVSWPNGHPGSLNNRYYFDDSLGAGATVYILDTGANLDSPEFSNDKLLSKSHNSRFITVGRDFDGNSPHDDSYTHVDPTKETGYKAHGTAMLSLVAGNTLGVAKRANVVIVRMPRKNAIGGGYSPQDFLDGLTKISTDIFLQPSVDGVSAVVLLAQGFPREVWVRKNPRTGDYLKDANGNNQYDDAGWMKRCKSLLSHLSTNNKALAIPGAGNIDFQVPIWPAAFARTTETDRLQDMLVVGAVSNDGKTLPYRIDPQGIGIPDVLAPGDDVTVAEGQPPKIKAGQTTRQAKGTSDASAITAGLAAYYLSLARSGQLPDSSQFENTPRGLKNYITNQGWVRSQLVNETPRGIWNGVTWDMQQNACKWDPNAQVSRRLRGRADSCPRPNPSTSSSTSSTSKTSSTSSSASKTSSTSTSSTSSTAAATPTTPLTEQSIVCNKESDFPGHGDILSAQEINFALRFCKGVDKVSQYIYPPGGDGPSGFQHTEDDSDGINYSYLMQWVDGCVTTKDKIKVSLPTESDSGWPCAGLMSNNYLKCANGGVGGSIQVGCAKYSFIGALGSAPKCDGCKEVELAPST